VNPEEVVGSGNEGLEAPDGEVLQVLLELPERGGGSHMLRERANHATGGVFVAIPAFSLFLTERVEHHRIRTLLATALALRGGARPVRTGAFAPRPGQERRGWRPTRSLARGGGRGLMSRLSPLMGISSGGCGRTRGTGSAGKGARMQAECP
jgi:hypothetical protein